MLTHEEIKKEVMPKLKESYLEDKRGEKLRNSVVQIFETSLNPYVIGLDLTEKAGDYLQPRSNSLSGTIFKEFHDWFLQRWNDDERKKALLTQDIQFRAYDVCSRRHTHLLPLAVNIYKLRDLGEHFVADIRRKVKQGFYKEAINCVIILKLQLYFGLHEVKNKQ